MVPVCPSMVPEQQQGARGGRQATNASLPGPGRTGAQAKEMKRRIYPNGIDILAMIGIILVSSLAAGLVGGR